VLEKAIIKMKLQSSVVAVTRMVVWQQVSLLQLKQQLQKLLKNRSIEWLHQRARILTSASMLVSTNNLVPMPSAQTQKAGVISLLRGEQDFGSASRHSQRLGHSSELKSFPRTEQKFPLMQKSQRFAL